MQGPLTAFILMLVSLWYPISSMIRCRTKTAAATLRIVKSTLRSGLQTTAQDIKHQDPVILNHFISVMWRVGDAITQGSERIKCGRSKFTIENEKCTKRLNTRLEKALAGYSPVWQCHLVKMLQYFRVKSNSLYKHLGRRNAVVRFVNSESVCRQIFTTKKPSYLSKTLWKKLKRQILKCYWVIHSSLIDSRPQKWHESGE